MKSRMFLKIPIEGKEESNVMFSGLKESEDVTYLQKLLYCK